MPKMVIIIIIKEAQKLIPLDLILKKQKKGSLWGDVIDEDKAASLPLNGSKVLTEQRGCGEKET